MGEHLRGLRHVKVPRILGLMAPQFARGLYDTLVVRILFLQA